jgi:hypothetical protein
MEIAQSTPLEEWTHSVRHGTHGATAKLGFALDHDSSYQARALARKEA